jgi:hypothetical protein
MTKKKVAPKQVVAKNMAEAQKLLEQGYVFVEPVNPDDEDLLLMAKA